MKRAVAAAAVGLLAAGCSLSSAGDTALPRISPDLPPSPSTWPAYPKFSSHSCWSRPGPPSTRPMQSAPSLPVRTGRRAQPAELVRRALARLGDESAIKGIKIGPLPPRRMIKHRFPGIRPPPDSLWAYVSAPDASHAQSPNRTPEQIRAAVLALWEMRLVGGALRDDFCQAGGSPLVGWSLAGAVYEGGVSAEGYALNQSFPNPSPAQFRARVTDIGKRFGFQPVSIRILRPRQLAPIVVVETDRDRREFMADVGEIIRLLDPQLRARQQTASTFEGFFFEARDSDGPFARVTRRLRGEASGGFWSSVPGFSRY